MNQFHRAELSTLGVVANTAAYRDGAEWFDQANAYMDDNHTFVESFVEQHMPDVGYTRNEGTFMTFLDFSKVMERIGAKEMAAKEGGTAEEYFQDWLTHQSGVYLNPGSSYGSAGEGHMRMNVASSRQVLREACEAMAAAVRNV